MRLIQLQLENFRQYSHLNVHFHNGITAIVGPNGSGKTTILEAMAWCLYGSSASRGKNESLRYIWGSAGSKMKCALSFEISDTTYHITRDENDCLLTQGPDRATSKIIAKSKDECTKQVEKILGMSLPQFRTSFFTQQKELNFMSYNSDKRREEIGKMLGFERIDTAWKMSREDIRQVESKIAGLAQGIGDGASLQLTLDRIRGEADSLKLGEKTAGEAAKLAEEQFVRIQPQKKALDEAAEKNRAYSSVIETSEKAQIVLQDQKEKAEFAKAEVAEAVARTTVIQPKVEKYSEIIKAISKLEELQQHEKDRAEKLGKIDGFTQQKEMLQKEVEQFAEADDLKKATIKALKEAEAFEQGVQKELTLENAAWSQEKGRLEAELKAVTKDISIHSAQLQKLERLGEHGICPTCERPLGLDFKQVIALYKEKLKSSEKELRETEQLFDEASKMPEKIVKLESQLTLAKTSTLAARDDDKNAEADVQKRDKILNDLGIMERKIEIEQRKIAALPGGYDEKEFKRLRVERAEIQPIFEESLGLRIKVENRVRVDLELREIEAKITKLNAEIKDARASIKLLEFDTTQHQRVTVEFTNLQDAMRKAAQEYELASERLNSAKAAYRQAAESYKEFQEREKQLKEARKIHERTKVTSEALRKLNHYLNQEVQPLLADYASDYISQLTDGRYTRIEVLDNFDFILKDEEIQKPVVSGGEEDVINLSLRLALARMITERAGQPLSLLVLDEVFASLDSDRRSSVLTVLENLKSWFEQIIIISHIESINDAADHCLFINYDPVHRKSTLVEKEENFDLASIIGNEPAEAPTLF